MNRALIQAARQQSLLFSAIVLFCFMAMSGGRETAMERAVQFGKHALSGRIAQFFGHISYAVYLCHYLILGPLISMLAQVDTYRTLPPVARFIILLAAASSIVIPASFLLHRKIELPGIELGRRVGDIFAARRRINLPTST